MKAIATHTKVHASNNSYVMVHYTFLLDEIIAIHWNQINEENVMPFILVRCTDQKRLRGATTAVHSLPTKNENMRANTEHI